MKLHALAVSLSALCAVGACAPAADNPEATVTQPAPAPAPATVRVPAVSDERAGTVTTNTNLPPLPATIIAERGGFIPEGIEFDRANNRFLTGSLSEGAIYSIGTNGSVNAFITDPGLVSSVGIEADEARDRLLVTNSDFTIFQGGGSGQAQLGVYSLTTGERLAMVDLGGLLNVAEDAQFFANDVAVADNGTAYVTDTRQNVVYQVDTNYVATVLHRFPASGEHALNGIEYHPDGYLLVADLNNGAIYKVPLDNPNATTEVALAEPVAGADGIVWRGDGTLAVVQNSATEGKVTTLVSSDAWASADVAAVAPHTGQATTGAAVGNDIYIVQPHFADQDPPSIHRAVFN